MAEPLNLKERLRNFGLVGGCYDLLYVDPIDLSSRGASVPTQTDGSLSRSWRGSSRAPSGPRTWGDGHPSLAGCAPSLGGLGRVARSASALAHQKGEYHV